MNAITLIVLNHKRSSNLPLILDALASQTVRPTIWLWNNATPQIVDSRIDMQVTTDRNLRCWPRWFLATYARTENVMMMDDDIMPSNSRLIEETIKILDAQCQPGVIVGAEGVILGPECGYWPSYPGKITRATITPCLHGSVHVRKVTENVNVDIIKGRCCALKTAAVQMLPLSPAHRDVCDDIAVSALLANGRKTLPLGVSMCWSCAN
jgi:hypothetical protein